MSAGSIPSDNSSTSSIIVRALDKNGDPTVGTFVTVAVTGTGTVTQPAAVTNAGGYAYGAYKTTAAGTKTVSATVDNIPVVATTLVTASAANTPDATKSTISADVSTVTVGNVCTLTLQAKDSTSTNITVGGATVIPTASGGTATGVLSGVTDNGNGTYTWTYTGSTAGTAQTLGATLNGVAVSTTLPTCAVTASSLLFDVRWSNSTGTSSNAMTDGGKWSGVDNPSGLAQGTRGVVTSGSSFGVTDNVLRIEHGTDVGRAFCYLDKAHSFWTNPQIGDTRTIRVGLTYLTSTDTIDRVFNGSGINSHHPFEFEGDPSTDTAYSTLSTAYNAGSSLDFDLLTAHHGDGTFRLILAPYRATFPKTKWYPTSNGTHSKLSNGTMYFLEMIWTKTGQSNSTTGIYSLLAQLSDKSGNVVVPASAFKDAQLNNPITSHGTNIPIYDDIMGRFRLGTNGGTCWTTPTPKVGLGNYSAWDRPAVSSSGTWIGVP